LFDGQDKETWYDIVIIFCLNIMFDILERYDKKKKKKLFSYDIWLVFVIFIVSIGWVSNYRIRNLFLIYHHDIMLFLKCCHFSNNDIMYLLL